MKMFNLLSKNIENIGHLGYSGSFTKGLITMGHHTCECGATSSGVDYLLDEQIVTNYLCVHYLAYHREEIPQEDMDIIQKLVGEVTIAETDKKNFEFCLQ